jgi:uncharacterized protein YlxW (UPF0749 family)
LVAAVPSIAAPSIIRHLTLLLASPLAAEIVNAFQSSVLQTQWEKLQTSIITSHNERVITTAEQLAHVQNELAQWRQHNSSVQSALDDKLDSLDSSFADKEVEVGYDVQQLEKKIGNVPVFGEEKGTGVCLEERMNLVNCFKSSNVSGNSESKSESGSRNNEAWNGCEEIVNAMERCTKKAVMA